MGSLAELLATGEQQTLEYFVLRLKEVSEPTVVHHELLDNASVLAHHARVFTHSALDLAAPPTLGEVFEHVVFDTSLRNAGAIIAATATVRTVAATATPASVIWPRRRPARSMRIVRGYLGDKTNCGERVAGALRRSASRMRRIACVIDAVRCVICEQSGACSRQSARRTS